MKIIIKGTNLKIDDVLYKYIEEKLDSLNKFLKGIEPDLVEARVEVGKTTNHHKKGDFFQAEINLGLPGRLLRSEAAREDIFMAITEVKDDLQKQIKEYKAKPVDNYKAGARKLKNK